MWAKIKKFGEDNWKFLLVMVLVVIAAVWVYPIAKKYVDNCVPTAAAGPVPAEASDDTSAKASVSVVASGVPVIPDAKKIGATSEDLARSYQTVDFEGQKKGMAMQGVTFMNYGQLMDFAHQAIADGARKVAPKKAPKKVEKRPAAAGRST